MRQRHARKTCTVEQLVAELQKRDQGMLVYLDDPDTGWLLGIGVVYAALNGEPVVEITAEYGDDPPSGSEFYYEQNPESES